MLQTGVILLGSFLYLGMLFAIAHMVDRRADAGRSVIGSPYIYALSLAVYCTAWTFYGSVGRAVRNGPGFLTIYLGPTLMAALGFFVIKKIIRVCKVYRITSIADFIASRYGKSPLIGGLVTIIAVIGILPYIALQLKAIAISFLLIDHYPNIQMPVHFTAIPVLHDAAFFIAVLLALFAILFGTRHLDITERHEGLVAAIAFESLVKLVAFLAVGAFVTFVMFGHPGELFRQAAHSPVRRLFTLAHNPHAYIDWMANLFLSMMAIICLPRQFQVAVVENVDERHLGKAIWLFPLYMLVINIFVLPIAIGGMITFAGTHVDADTFVLTLPMLAHQQALALFVFIGGMSAATGMVIVESVALSTMLCNDLFMPVLLRMHSLGLAARENLSNLLIALRRGSIVLIMLLSYIYFRSVGEIYTLVSIGLVSFAAVAQFAPALLGGLFWRAGNRTGAFWGLTTGTLVWFYTLVLPSLAPAGLLPMSFITKGPFGIGWLRPYRLFGLTDFSEVAHAVFWSMLFNVGFYIVGSLFSGASDLEQSQAALFVNVFKVTGETGEAAKRRGIASVSDLQTLLERFLGRDRADEILNAYGREYDMEWRRGLNADPGLVGHVEQVLAGSIGSASAHAVIGWIIKEEPPRFETIMNLLDETRQVINYSRELEAATTELKAANERLKELDRLKDDFVSTVTHELRTPLTAIRSIAEIIHSDPGLDRPRTERFSGIIIQESERLTRLISQVLDVQKIEAGQISWQRNKIRINGIVRDAVTGTRRLIEDKAIRLDIDVPADLAEIEGDPDRLIQVLHNLISNAVKFCPETNGHIIIRARADKAHVRVDVIDNGVGIVHEEQDRIFDKFHQARNTGLGRPAGSGLGLSISRSIVEFHNGRIWVRSTPGRGATFSFTLPRPLPQEG